MISQRSFEILELGMSLCVKDMKNLFSKVFKMMIRLELLLFEKDLQDFGSKIFSSLECVSV